MEPALFRDSTAQALGWTSLAILAVGELPQTWRTRGSYGARTDRGSYWVWFFFWALGISLAYEAAEHVRALSLSGGEWWPVVVGLVLFWTGVAIRWWAVLTLGRFFKLTVVVEEGQRVIRSGPYRYVRHPAYLGAMLLVLGIGVAFDNVLSILACLVFPLLGVLRRIKVEEDALCRSLGPSYRDYAARTPRLIPGLW
jgi:protein-S-isoprenylcysteine O-methyltransferase Ste14